MLYMDITVVDVLRPAEGATVEPLSSPWGTQTFLSRLMVISTGTIWPSLMWRSMS